MGSPVSYMTSNIGWTFNFVVATIWFWAFGFTVVDKYGYSTTNTFVSSNPTISRSRNDTAGGFCINEQKRRCERSH